ncbi:Transient receptor putative cation channel sub M member 6 [Nowakowskiella sp. JEL0078]|nr:Transient receptor putative cation channel sub M member 6 [Nowakowskiella sp. JEL0078]
METSETTSQALPSPPNSAVDSSKTLENSAKHDDENILSSLGLSLEFGSALFDDFDFNSDFSTIHEKLVSQKSESPKVEVESNTATVPIIVTPTQPDSTLENTIEDNNSDIGYHTNEETDHNHLDASPRSSRPSSPISIERAHVPPPSRYSLQLETELNLQKSKSNESLNIPSSSAKSVEESPISPKKESYNQYVDFEEIQSKSGNVEPSDYRNYSSVKSPSNDDIPPPLPPKDNSPEFRKRITRFSQLSLSHRQSNSTIRSDISWSPNLERPTLPHRPEIQAEIDLLEQQNTGLKKELRALDQLFASLKRYRDYFQSFDKRIQDTEQQVFLQKKANEAAEKTRIMTTLAGIEIAKKHRGSRVDFINFRNKQIYMFTRLMNLQKEAQFYIHDNEEIEKSQNRRLVDRSKKLKETLEQNDNTEQKWMSANLGYPREIAGYKEYIQYAIRERYQIISEREAISKEIYPLKYLVQERENYLNKLENWWAGYSLPLEKAKHIAEGMVQGKKIEFMKLKRKIEWEGQIAFLNEISHNLIIDKTNPFLHTDYKWGPCLQNIEIQQYVAMRTKPYRLGTINFPFDIQNMIPVKKTSSIWLMGAINPTTIFPPFAKGTYRTARYCMREDGMPYVIKAFHLRKSLLEDSKGAERVAKTNALVQFLGREFTHRLQQDRAFSGYVLEFLDVYISQCWFRTPESEANKLPDDTCVMIEPLAVGRFRKWLNNNMRLLGDEFGKVDHMLMECFAHWSLEATDSNLMVGDLQGVKIEGENRWSLLDPVLHFVGPGADEIKRVLGHDWDGDMGITALDEFSSQHHCNAFCRALRLRPLHNPNGCVGCNPAPPPIT